MKSLLKIISNPKVADVFNGYPIEVRAKMNLLRNLVIETANELETIEELEETLKWGEPSFLCKTGSTLRMDWKKKTPDQYALYFKCTSKLVETFKKVFDGVFKFEGKRAIVFNLEDEIPAKELKLCIGAALNYHKVKKMPLLNIHY